MGKELLLEIGTEEIPARFIPGTLKQMTDKAGRIMAEARIEAKGIAAYGTPRRLILCVEDLADHQESFVEEVTGPPKRISYDAQGQPTKAALGFAKNQGISVEQLQVKEIGGKGEYLLAVKEHRGQETKELLAGLLLRFIPSLSFPTVMRWGEGSFMFARPLHWLLALYGGEIIPFSLDGIKSADLSYGHRFTSPDSFKVSGFVSFVQKTEEAQVIIDPQKRKKLIQEQIASLAQEAGGRLPDDPELLDTVTYLVEYPQAVCGSFDKCFLQLPPEVLITSMRSHQKYFPLYDQNNRLMAKFIAVSNIKAKDYGLIRAGNERVLRARLADAEFFFHEDRKKPLTDFVESLKKVVFQEKLGTVYDKVERIRKIVALLGKMVCTADEYKGQEKEILEQADRAAFLCKTDLVTEMVFEFPELQGIMGREYALYSGEKPEVAKAIYEHYLPRFQNDDLPRSLVGALVAMADKMDNIVGCFGLNLIPTGSEDPYALRRQALGIVQIILQGGYILSLTELVRDVFQLLGNKLTRGPEEVSNEVIIFFQQRMKSLFSSQGHIFDTIEAVLATGDDDIIRIREKVEAVSNFRKKSGFEALMTSFKRVINIIPKEYTAEPVDPSVLEEEAEKKLYNQLMEVRGQVSAMLQHEKYEQILQELAGLKGYIDAFFEEILVMAGDEKLKRNRLSLLSAIRNIFFQVVDFSKIVAERG